MGCDSSMNQRFSDSSKEGSNPCNHGRSEPRTIYSEMSDGGGGPTTEEVLVFASCPIYVKTSMLNQR